MRTKPVRLRLASIVLLTLVCAVSVPSSMAQSAGTAGLSGIITDSSRAAIPNAAVTLTSNGTNQSRTTLTGVDGQYKFTLLPPGSYKITFAVPGFKSSEVSSVTLNVTENPMLNRTLEVGANSEQVAVEAAAETLQSGTSSLGTTVQSRTVTALPLSNRNYTQILSLSAGANAAVSNATAFGKATQDMSVYGNDPGQNNFQMDGVAINNIANGGSANDSSIYAGMGIPNPDAIEEFKIQTSTYDASYRSQSPFAIDFDLLYDVHASHGIIRIPWNRKESQKSDSKLDSKEGKQLILLGILRKLAFYH